MPISFGRNLRNGCESFNLELHPEKTRLWSSVGTRSTNAKRRGQGKPETFNFLGFTHICGKKKKQRTVHGAAADDSQAVAGEAERGESRTPATHARPHPGSGQVVASGGRGHIRYYGVPQNHNALYMFRFQVGRLWHRALSRRSQNGRVPWDRMRRLVNRWLPLPAVCHPYPLRRMGVIT